MRKYFEINIHLYLVMLISTLLFIMIYGVEVLDVTYTDWLMTGGDLSQHYLGWKFFRNADWQRQVGMMNNIAYPFSESVIYTDSIPIMAVLCKLVRNLLPQHFQYFGLWGLLCFILQGLFSALLLQKYLCHKDGTVNRIQVVIGSMFFVLAPIMLRRMFWHTSLAAHWMILLALLFYVYHDEWFAKLWKCAVCWGLMGILCASVHLYFIPMCGVILLGFLARDFLQNKKTGRLVVSLLSYMISAFLGIWILGGFSSDMLDGAPGLGYYSFNLNGFMNPQEWSAFFSDLNHYADGQYEGFAYLGVGILILLAVEVCGYMYDFIMTVVNGKIQRKPWLAKHIITVVIFTLTVLMSASHELSFGKCLIFKVPLPAKIESLWAIFRASGRLIWPAVYILMLFAICEGAKMLSRCSHLFRHATDSVQHHRKNIVWTTALVICLIMQVLELRPQLIRKHNEFNRRVIYQSLLQDSFFSGVLMGLDLKAVVFADKNELSQEALYAFADYASDRKMSINDFYFARALSYSAEAVAEDFLKHPDHKTIYIFTWKNRWKCPDYELYYYVADGYIIGLKSPLATRTPVDSSEMIQWKEAEDDETL